MYYVYVLRSDKDNCLYIGQTNNLQDRLRRHNSGEIKSTRNRKPLRIVYSEEYKTRAESLKREKYLKKLKGGNEFKKIIKSKIK